MSHNSSIAEHYGSAQALRNTPQRQREEEVNVGSVERKLSLASGGLLLVGGILRRDIPGLIVAGFGGALLYRGATGHCSVYNALGVDSVHGTSANERSSGIEVVETFLIDKPAAELYRFWHDFENLPTVMTHLKSVERLDNRRTHWIVEAPALVGGSVEWDATITEDKPDSFIAWRSEPNSQIDNAGSVQFTKAPGDRGTAVRIELKYSPPAGRLGRFVAKLFGSDPETLIREDLRNFKRFMEVGEILTLDGQPRGGCVAGVGRFLH